MVCETEASLDSRLSESPELTFARVAVFNKRELTKIGVTVALYVLAGILSHTTAAIVNDGETIWLEGVALIGLYGIIAAAFWWG
jgi:Ca2+/H+ antiporter